MNFVILTSFFLLLVKGRFCFYFPDSNDSKCTTTDNNPGICIPVGDCSEVWKNKTALRSAKICGFKERISIICCSKNNLNKTVHKITETNEDQPSVVRSEPDETETNEDQPSVVRSEPDETKTNKDQVLPEINKEKQIFETKNQQEEPTILVQQIIKSNQETSLTPVKETYFECGIFQQIINKTQTGINKTFHRFRRKRFVVDGEPAELLDPFEIVNTTHIFKNYRTNWPWIALIGFQKSSNNSRSDKTEWLCGGSLINLSWVLTAAHCVRGKLSTNPSLLVVRLGEYDLESDDDIHQELLVSRVVLHPEYHQHENDIALLQLATNAKLDEVVVPICLPSFNINLTAGRRVQIAGWGMLEYRGETADILQEAELELIDSKQCEKIYQTKLPDFNSTFPKGFENTKICTVDPQGGNTDVCKGDSGGPLTIEENGRFYVIGIVSFGIGCGNPDFPSVYTKVKSYLDWINNTIIAN